jgi:myosin heavy subunit
METQQQGKNNSKIWIILFAVSAVLNLWQWRHATTSINTLESRVDTLIVEQVNIEKELSDTKSELEKYRGISANLDSLLNEAQAKIEEQEKKIKSVSGQASNYKELNAKLKQQLADLQALRDEYLGRIDSLLMANKQLQTEKEQLTTNLESVSKNLETTVATASVLKAEYVTATVSQRRSNGKYKETMLAKRAHKMDVCFDVMDNKIAKAGLRNVYLKITEPGGKPLGNRSTGSGSFTTAGGEEVMYAATTTVDYKGTKISKVCLSYEEKDDKMFAAGTYLVEIYIDNQLAGAGSAVLR